MRQISSTSVARWQSFGGVEIPVALDEVCPYCRRIVTFHFQAFTALLYDRSMGAQARCPGCGQSITLWSIGAVTRDISGVYRPVSLWMHPPGAGLRGQIEGADLIPPKIRRAYGEALKTYNAGIWGTTATQCRRTLEGLAKDHVARWGIASGPNLASMLREIAKDPELGKPLADLAEAIRAGGNIGAHFDDDAEADDRVAGTMLDLLEYLLEYFYTIPSLIASAREVLARPAPGEGDDQPRE